MPCVYSDFRWEVISNFIKQHVPESTKSARDVLAKAKELQKNGRNVFQLSKIKVSHV